MVQELRRFWRNEEGQDLVEYTFLVTLAALGAVGLLRNQGTFVSSIWVTGKAVAHNAAVTAS